MSYTLLEMQQDFKAHLQNDDTKILNHIVSTEHVSAETRMRIYHHAYYSRLVDILALDFPVLKHLMGEERFAKMARNYVETFPSQHYSVRLFGQNLVKFLQQFPELDSLYIEMAKFEWSVAVTLDAADGSLLTVSDMAQIAPENWFALQFFVHPSMCIEALNYNVGDIWLAIKDNQPYEIRSAEQCINWLLWRFQQQTYFMPLSAEEYHVIKNLNEGKNFGEVCEELCQYLEEEQVVQFVAGTLRGWVEQGLFSRVVLQNLQQ